MNPVPDSRVTAYRFPVPAAAWLASLIGMRFDMQRVIAYCDLMIERYAAERLNQDPSFIGRFNTTFDFDDWNALSTAASYQLREMFRVRGSTIP